MGTDNTAHLFDPPYKKNGVLHSDRNGYKRSYYPEIYQRQELAHNYATHIVDDFMAVLLRI